METIKEIYNRLCEEEVLRKEFREKRRQKEIYSVNFWLAKELNFDWIK